jgi:hypothetical protein
VIKHIVMWRLKDSANGKTRAENAQLLKQMLEALNGKIPGLRRIELGINLPDSHSGADDADVILYSEFDDLAALEAYYPHPEHAKLKPFVQSIRAERRVINYEV